MLYSCRHRRLSGMSHDMSSRSNVGGAVVFVRSSSLLARRAQDTDQQPCTTSADNLVLLNLAHWLGVDLPTLLALRAHGYTNLSCRNIRCRMSRLAVGYGKQQLCASQG